MLQSPYIKKSLEQLENIYTALRKNNITLSKSEAMKIVGGRYVLERLVTSGKIRAVEQGKAGHKWHFPVCRENFHGYGAGFHSRTNLQKTGYAVSIIR